MKLIIAGCLCGSLMLGTPLRSAAAPADLDLTFDPGSSLDQMARAVAVQPDGSVLVGGVFTMVPGMLCSGLARFRADGAVDSSFTPALAVSEPGGKAVVSCIAVQGDGKILIGGGFSSVNGVARAGFARLNPDGSLDNSFLNNLAGPDMAVTCIWIQNDGKLLIGGSFSSFNGVPRGRVARLNPDGTLDTSFLNGLEGAKGGNNALYGIHVQEDGKIYVGGSFESFNSVTRSNLARLNPDGSLDMTFLNGLTGPDGWVGYVKGFAIQKDGKVLIGGYFRSVNGVPRAGAARLNPDGSVDESFTANVEHSYSLPTLAIQPDGKILLAGSFTAVNGVPHGCLVRLNSDGSVDDSFQDNLQYQWDFGVECMQLLPNGTIVAAGNFYYGTLSAGGARLCRLNPDGSIDTTFNLGKTGPDATIRTIVRQADGRILIGGDFHAVSGASYGGLARLNVDGTPDQGFLNILGGDYSEVYALALDTEGRVVVGGGLSLFNGSARHALVRVSGDGALDNTFSDPIAPQYGYYVSALAVQPDGKILIGGTFTITNGPARTNIARLNPDGSVDPSFACSIKSANMSWTQLEVLALQPDGRILISGIFDIVNGTTRPNFARLNPDGSLDDSFANATSGARCRALVLQPDGKMLIGGYGWIARYNADGSLDSSFLRGTADSGDSWFTLGLQSDGKIVVGGGFRTFNGVSCPGLARLLADGSVDSTFRDNQSGPNNTIDTIVPQPDGKILIGGDFTTVNGMLRSFVARLEGSYSPPVIVRGPKSQTAETGSSVRLAVRATGSPPLGYQWFFAETNCLSAGTTCSNLDLTALTGSQIGSYTVVVTNFSGVVTSAPAMLNVIAPVARRLVPGLQLTAAPGVTMNLDYAGSMDAPALWGPLDTVTLTASPQYYFDLASPLSPQRYYRARSSEGAGMPALLNLSLTPALTLTGNVGGSIRVEGINAIGPVDAWFSVATVMLTNSSQLYFDVSAVGQPARLYRLVPGP